jgi:hypothetical protein
MLGLTRCAHREHQVFSQDLMPLIFFAVFGSISLDGTVVIWNGVLDLAAFYRISPSMSPYLPNVCLERLRRKH